MSKSLSNLFSLHSEFTEHQRNVFCVFSGDGVNRLRSYLNDNLPATYDEGTMYDDRDGDDADQTVVGLMQITGLGPDDEAMDDDVDGGEGSVYGGEADG